jgi:hypothetical protein
MNSITLLDKDIPRFWSKVDKNKPDKCWEWKSYRFKKGYGGFQLRTHNTAAHRVSWVINFGNIPDGFCVCHKCDNPSCVNPNHLFLGTVAENNKDRAKKGRSADTNGERNPAAKLKNELIPIIREKSERGLSQRKIAKEFGVGKSTIARIIHKTHWRLIE